MGDKKHEMIEQTLCKELDEFESKMKQGQKLQLQDYEILHHIYSILAKRETYLAMKGEYGDEEWNGEEGNSGRRGRSPMTGRYVSRSSYDDGYARGFSEAMNEMGGNSGHYPMPPYYPARRY